MAVAHFIAALGQFGVATRAHQHNFGGATFFVVGGDIKDTAFFIADGARELHALEAETGKYFHF